LKRESQDKGNGGGICSNKKTRMMMKTKAMVGEFVAIRRLG